MTLTLYFLRQFLLPLVFGAALFVFVLLLDRLFDLFDLIFNKGINVATVGKLFVLFVPTVVPLALPMAILLSCVVTFGRLSEENEVTAIRAAGIPLPRVFWSIPFFAFLVSVALLPFNARTAPWANRMFRKIYEQIVHAEPLLKVEPRKFFSIRNMKIFADSVDSKESLLRNLFVYQLPPDGRPADRIFAHSGVIESSADRFNLTLESGQLERYDLANPANVIHITFDTYKISVPLKMGEEVNSTRFRSISTPELKKLIGDLQSRGLPTRPLGAELRLRTAIAFAPFCLSVIGIPLALALRRGGRTFGFGVTIGVIFVYYLLLIFGLTLAEKGLFPPAPALWMGNAFCLLTGGLLIVRVARR